MLKVLFMFKVFELMQIEKMKTTNEKIKFEEELN